MGKRGRLPTGTSASAEYRRDNAPLVAPAEGRPTQPPGLSSEAQAAWRRLVACLPKGSVGKSDSASIALAARLMADATACRESFESNTRDWSSGEARHLLKLESQLFAVLCRLGMTPSDRQRIPKAVEATKGRISRFTAIA